MLVNLKVIDFTSVGEDITGFQLLNLNWRIALCGEHKCLTKTEGSHSGGPAISPSQTGMFGPSPKFHSLVFSTNVNATIVIEEILNHQQSPEDLFSWKHRWRAIKHVLKYLNLHKLNGGPADISFANLASAASVAHWTVEGFHGSSQWIKDLITDCVLEKRICIIVSRCCCAACNTIFSNGT